MTTTMQAERVHSFGGPDVLELEEVPRPEPKENELLVHVRAAGVNPTVALRSGLYVNAGQAAVVGNPARSMLSLRQRFDL